jgi:hypothetical protein
MASRKKAKATKVFVLPDGRKYKVTGETGKYVLCENGIQFRRNRGELADLPVAKEPEAAE